MSTLLPANKSYWLQRVCENNYDRLLRLLPNLDRLEQTVLEDEGGKPALHAKLLERTPYTLTLELTHYFSDGEEWNPEPAVQVRIFLHAKLSEVMCADSKPAVRDALSPNPSAKAVLDYKWRLNYFLEKWLDHCLRHDYRPMPEVYGA